MKKGYIYGIFLDKRCLYIGSCWNFIERQRTHRKDYKYRNTLIYSFIELLKDEWKSIEFKILKEDMYEHKDYLLMDEREYIDCCPDQTLNEELPYIPDFERKDIEKSYRNKTYNKHKEHILKKQKNYYEKNKDEIYERKIQRTKERKICSICGGFYSYGNKQKHEKSIKHINSMK